MTMKWGGGDYIYDDEMGGGGDFSLKEIYI